ncbi:MAG: flagellar motor protein MotB [Chlorobi bacterium]|nr:flagellar motor protein MotB [Chlorobiota bacterium]
MKRFVWLLMATVLVAGTSSCVSKKKYREALARYEQADKNYKKFRQNYMECKVDNEKLRSRIKALESSNAGLQKALDKCISLNQQGNVNIQNLIEKINSANEYIRSLVEIYHRQDSLNRVLKEQLTKSVADVNPDDEDLDIKVQKGVVFISLSDKMLFKSGSTRINPQADKVLAKIAKIINAHPDYEILIVGNTDNVPIRTNCIKDNWDLSVLRATAITRRLQHKFGVDPKRMTAGGRGEWNPKAPNDTEEGRRLNRRTEIILMPDLDQFLSLMKQVEE